MWMLRLVDFNKGLIGRGNPRYSEMCLSQCVSLHHKSYMRRCYYLVSTIRYSIFFMFYWWYCRYIILISFKNSLFSDSCWTEHFVLLHCHVCSFCDTKTFSYTICKFVHDSSPYQISPSLSLPANLKLKFDWSPFSRSCAKFTNEWL